MQSTATEVARAFEVSWTAHHQGRQPMGWALRDDDGLDWVRFHALPDSDRYAETDEEMDIILARGNLLANELLGPGSDCWVICARWDEIDGPGDFAGSWTEDGSDSYSIVWRYFVRKDTWLAGKYDNEIQEIADDAPHYIVWFDGRSGKVFAPYDGGFDLFPGSPEAVTDLKRRHSSWLSNRKDGL